MTETNYKIEYININNLKLSEYNPRIHDKSMIEQLEKSIKEFGLVDPVIVNSNPKRMNILIGGHARVKASRNIGIKKIPVVYVNLDIEQEKLLNLKLNAISGEWDFSCPRRTLR